MTDGMMTEQQAVNAAVAQLQPQIDELFLLAFENGEFKTPTILIRVKIGEKGKVSDTSVLSEEYKESEFGKVTADLVKNLELPPQMQGKTLRLRLMWSDAFAQLGQAALVPVKEEIIEKVYIGSTIHTKFETSIQEMFQKLDELIGVPVYSQTLVELSIGKGGKVQKAQVSDEAFRGTLLDQHVGEILKKWEFPGIKKAVTQTIALQRAVAMATQSGEEKMTTGEGQATANPYVMQQRMAWKYPFGGGTATEILAYPTRPIFPGTFPIPGGGFTDPAPIPFRQNLITPAAQQLQFQGLGGGAVEPVAYPFRTDFNAQAGLAQQFQVPQYGGGATEVMAYPTRPFGGFQYWGGPATEMHPYPFRPSVQFVVPQQYQFPKFGGGATEIPAYPIRQTFQTQLPQQYQMPAFGGGATEIIAYPFRPPVQTTFPQQFQYPVWGGGATEVIPYPTRPFGGFQYYGGPATEMHPYPFRQLVQQFPGYVY